MCVCVCVFLDVGVVVTEFVVDLIRIRKIVRAINGVGVFIVE